MFVGGPHGSFTTQFLWPLPNWLIYMGYPVLGINYIGSLNRSETIAQLTGNYGMLDVQSCSQIINQFLHKHPDQGNAGIVLMGGSHGGFLTAWLAGLSTFEHRHLLRGAILRNPVCDYRSILMTNDIPDYIGVACGLDTNEMLSQRKSNLYDRSPISVVNNVQCPVLLLLGAKDRRVPMQQGLSWYHLLPQQNYEKKLNRIKIFADDNHGLERATSEAGSAQAILDFLQNAVIN